MRKYWISYWWQKDGEEGPGNTEFTVYQDRPLSLIIIRDVECNIKLKFGCVRWWH